MSVSTVLVKIWDGITAAVVKPGSTAPVATDAALVTAISPNSLASDNSSNGAKLPVISARANAAAPSWTEGNQGPLSVDLAGNLRILLSSWLGSTAPTVGQKTMAASIPVVLASNQTNLAVQGASASSSAVTQASSAATSATLLAANTSRIGATIFNDSTATLYLKFGTTASATSYTVQILPGGYYEVPFGYTGKIDGIWSAANGFAYVTELTP